MLKGKTVTSSPVSLLKIGRQNVCIISMHELTDRHNDLSGGRKDFNPELYIDETEQIALIYGNDNGVLTNRYNLTGFIKFAELDDTAGLININGYACKKANIKWNDAPAEIKASDEYFEKKGFVATKKDGKDIKASFPTRLISEKRTEACINIISDVASATGAAMGDDIEESLSNAISERTELSVEVYEDTFGDKTNLKIQYPRKANALDTVSKSKEVEAEVKEPEVKEPF